MTPLETLGKVKHSDQPTGMSDGQTREAKEPERTLIKL